MTNATLVDPATEQKLDANQAEPPKPITHIAIICSKGSLDMAYPGLILANAARMSGIDATLFFTFWGLDIVNKSKEARQHPLAMERVRFLLGSSTAPEIVEEVRGEIEGKRVMVILDSDHSRAHVARELEIYAPMVSVGSYLIVQDSVLGGHPVNQPSASYEGPYEAIEEFLATNDEFEADRWRERLMFTYCPKGYLKRIK